ncbi:hypothetical protein BFS25_11445 [Bifidobacterium longum subsp. infantis]|nr:hypothetical protein BFS25_11445 [Bifidobacterium longum subsp. infantis]
MILYQLSFGAKNQKKYIFMFMEKTGTKKKLFFSPILLKEKVIKLLVLIYHLMVREKIKILNVIYGMEYMT